MGTLGEKLGHIIIPLVTAFNKDTGEVDYDQTQKLADDLINKNFCDSIVVTGTTGEFNTLTFEERITLFKVIKEAVQNRVPVVAGSGAASAREAVRLTQEAERLGYETAMVVCPYYCKPDQKGIYQYFATVAQSVSIDIMLYNIPLFTGVNINPQTVTRLAELKNIKGIKDEAGLNPTQMTEYAMLTPEDFTIYNGDDIMVLCGLAQGAAGVVSGGSHILGDQIRNMINLFLQGQIVKARDIHNQLDPFFKALGANDRVNPIPILRAAIEIAGYPVGPPRLPLVEATVEEKQMIKKHLVRLGVI